MNTTDFDLSIFGSYVRSVLTSQTLRGLNGAVRRLKGYVAHVTGSSTAGQEVVDFLLDLREDGCSVEEALALALAHDAWAY
jgi:hypothetical protein